MSRSPAVESSRVRVDKWLWAARFFKSRSLAIEALEGGKVKLNGERTKPAKELKVGDRLAIQLGDHLWEISVLALSERRGPAEAARALYVEEESSRLRRLQQIEARRLQGSPGAETKGRPTKRARRLIHRFTETG